MITDHIKDAYEKTDSPLESEGDWVGCKSFLAYGKPNSTHGVILDLQQRERVGFKKYGKLVHESSDDMLQHLYEELLDAAVYIKTLMNQRNEKCS